MARWFSYRSNADCLSPSRWHLGIISFSHQHHINQKVIHFLHSSVSFSSRVTKFRPIDYKLEWKFVKDWNLPTFLFQPTRWLKWNLKRHIGAFFSSSKHQLELEFWELILYLCIFQFIFLFLGPPEGWKSSFIIIYSLSVHK